jgi:hypothetical protein
MLKYNAFVFEFASELLRDKIASHDLTLRPSDYEAFLTSKSDEHRELHELKESSKTKIRNVLLRMLSEAGLLLEGESLGTIQRPALSPSVQRAIRDDQPSLLAGFLFPDSEIAYT